MSRMMGLFLTLYVFFASWTSAYKLHDLLTIPNIILISSIALYFFILVKNKKAVKGVYHGEDILLLLFLMMMLVSYLVNDGNQNYIIAYFFTFCLNYLLMKSAYCSTIDISRVFRINGIAIVFVSMFLLVEFSLQYFFDLNIREVLLFGDTPSATYLGIFHRSYGFSTEPTNVGYYLNTLGPLGIWYWIKCKKHKLWPSIILILVILTGWITTFSAAAFISLILSMTIVAFFILLRGSKVRLSKKGVLAMLIAAVFLVSALLIYEYVADAETSLTYYIKPIMKKITLVSQSNQEDSRINRWSRDLASFREHPLLGYGPGMTTIYHGGSSVNWYLNILVENGIVALVTILTFFFITFVRIYQSPIENRYYFLTGYLSAVIYLFTLSTFYDPALWILLILFHCYSQIVISHENLDINGENNHVKL